MLTLVLCILCSQTEAAPATKKENDDQRVAIAKTLVEHLAAGRFDAATGPFDATMKKALTPAQLQSIWTATVGQFGPFQKISATRIESVPPYTIVFATLKLARGQLDAKVVLDKDNKIAGFFFVPAGKYQSPAYVDSARFKEQEVQVGKGLFPLSGTLSLPNGEGPFPAIVLVHGSGPHDRDETIGPNKPFRDLAHGLASRGIAVLRYEKRTKQHPAAMLLLGNSVTVKEETISDVAAAVDTLALQEKIKPKRIFVLGHSLGGMLLPRIATATDKPAGYISLAGSTRPMEDLIVEQTKYIVGLGEKPTEEEQKQLAEIEKQVALVKSDKLTKDTPTSDLPLSVPAKYWLDLRGYDPAEAAKKIKQPLLILQGERDYQVTMTDFARWREALGSRADVKLISYPKLNHLFMAGEGKSVPLEYFEAGSVDAAVIDDIVKWLELRTK